MTLIEKIEEYYIKGYGFPVKYYTDKNLDKFVKNNIITKEQAKAIKEKKKAII